MDKFGEFFAMYGTTMIFGLIAIYFVVKNAVKNGIKTAFTEMKQEERTNETQRIK